MAVFKDNDAYQDWTNINSVMGSEVDMCFQLTGPNQKPFPPNFPNPPEKVPPEEDVTIDINSIDPEGNPLYYFIDWGDGKTLESDFYESGETITFSHIWYDKGTYLIKAKAIDIHGAESEWSSIELEVPRNIIPIPIKFLRLFERFPNVFPILRQLLDL
jgi:hypothetical protein